MSQTETTEPTTVPRETLPTIWEVSDDMWNHIFLPLLTQLDPPSRMGRPRADQRKCLDGMIYRARTGCQWNQLPDKFGSDSTVHRTLRRWDDQGVFDQVWALLIYHCEDFNDVYWEWQAADGMLNKARFIGDGRKGGIKRSSQKRQESGVPKPRRSAPTESARIPRIGQSWASRPVCLSRAGADRWLCASPART